MMTVVCRREQTFVNIDWHEGRRVTALAAALHTDGSNRYRDQTPIAAIGCGALKGLTVRHKVANEDFIDCHHTEV